VSELNNVIDAIKNRRSVRSFSNEPISNSDILTILESATWAPSGGNNQNWGFIAVTNNEVKNKMFSVVKDKLVSVVSNINSASALKSFNDYANYFGFFASAPVVVAVIKKPYDSLIQRMFKRYGVEEEYISTAGEQGVSAAIENMLLCAHSMGYGSCWMSGPLIAKKELEGMLEISSPDELFALVPIGRAKDIVKPTKRKPINEVVRII